MALFLGIDASTQGIKAELIDVTKEKLVASFAVQFGKDLPNYQAPNGFVVNPDPLIVQADPLMWLDALQLLMEKMVASGAPLNEVAGISGSGQQHGTVYLNDRFSDVLKSLPSCDRLSEAIAPALSRKLSPIWMDRSTENQCRELDLRFGSVLRDRTGSPAIERFSGPQIMKFAEESPAAYRETSRIHLVSSFLASVLAGKSAPIDYGDGAGMNLLNLETLRFDREIAEFTAPGLLGKLPELAPGDTVIGAISPFFCQYGFSPDTQVAIWTGDNPSSLIGVGAGEVGVAVISLGTSDTFFAAMRNFRTDPAGFGHVFGNPAGGFMSLICFSNGSLARERVKDDCGADWTFFDQTSCEVTVKGNHGKLMLPYFTPESTPLVLNPGVVYNFDPASATPAEKIRCCLESQALSMRLHSQWQMENFKRIRVTGGASRSAAFRTILADVFQAEIETIQVGNSAGLGAALRGANAIGQVSWDKLFAAFTGTSEVVSPDRSASALYQSMLDEYRSLEL